MTQHIHVTVACLVEDQGRYLMVYEHDAGKHVYNQPAGHVEHGETLLEAAHRETREETAWEIELTGILGFYWYQSPRNGDLYYRTAFIAQPVKQLHTQLDSDVIEPRWLSYEALQQRAPQMRSPLVMQAIDDYRAGQRFALDTIKYTMD